MDEYDTLTISALKTLLDARGASTVYKVKADLVQRLRNLRTKSTTGFNEEEIITLADSIDEDDDKSADDTFDQNNDESTNSNNSTRSGINDEFS